MPLGTLIAFCAATRIAEPVRLQEPTAFVLRNARVRVEMDADSGHYEVLRTDLGWRLEGELGGNAEPAKIRTGTDGAGAYREIDFVRAGGTRFEGVIRLYDAKSVVWFRARYAGGCSGNGIEFPQLTLTGPDVHAFSYQDRTFAPPTFGAAPTATPWLLFDDSARSMVISPASEFMVSGMTGSPAAGFGVALDPKVRRVPAGFDQDSVLAFGDGIGRTFGLWGAAMRALFHKRAPSNDADTILKDFGYWTDNGADYYYNYDPNLGYAGTLLQVARRYRQEGIPLGYLQLDSWWYEKSTDDASGKAGGAKKNSRLPEGAWNRYGGLISYQADPSLFPDGLPKFRQEIGLPLVVHNRWVDRNSPYHERYKISGIAAVDPAWWNDIIGYVKRAGVLCYEQDWLDPIYANSPEMATTIGVGDAFTNDMAAACEGKGLSMQYCMGTARFFMQGLKYPNLTTIRTSGDRFEPGKWNHFLYVSRLAYDVGVWPWCDVFKSGETSNMILSVLSAGPVGTGDALGKEDKANILRAARIDGVIVKPDRPIIPIDRTYIDDANHSAAPFVASTYTRDSGQRTTYVFAFPRGKRAAQTFEFRTRDVGISRPAYVYDFLDGSLRLLGPDEPVQTALDAGYSYRMVVPRRAGITLLGDLAKFVPTGKQRIAEIEVVGGRPRVTVSFAKGEEGVVLTGVADRTPVAQASAGAATVRSYDAATGKFEVEVRPDRTGVHAVFTLR